MDDKVTVTLDFQDAEQYTTLQVAITLLHVLAERHDYTAGVEIAEEAQEALDDTITAYQ